MRRTLFALTGLVSSLGVLGCSPSPAATDAGAVDAFRAPIDGNGADVSAPPVDAYLPRSDAGRPSGTVAERARAIATTLRGSPRLLVGMGNDLDGAPTYDADRAGVYTLGTTLDIHYTYLTGYSDQGGWSTWNTNGAFATILADACQRNGGLAPMFTYYQLALDYENGNDTLRDADRMHVYLSDVHLLFQRLGEYGHPALVQLEPDFFGYLQARMRDMGTTPDAYAAELHFGDVPECASVPATAAGLVECFVRMRDALAPMTLLGLHASAWADSWDDRTASPSEIEAKAQSVAAFLGAMRADLVEFVTVEALDRDAGFWETSGGNAGTCSVTGGTRGAVYWDETNATRPNFTDHIHWVSALTTALGRPALWWQLPFGAPETTCGGPGGGSDGHWRDNRVHYFFSHPEQLVAAGAFGMVFGTGAGRQTDWTTDGNAFHDAVNAYVAAPVGL